MATDERGTERKVQSKGLGSNVPDKKKGSKFQPFKKLFGRRKKRETTPDRETTKLKASSSFGNVCNGALSSDEETNNGLRSPSYSMGTRAFSHESIFMPDGRAESEESIQAMSQDNLVGKVKTLQQQLAKNIKFGQPSQMTVSVKTPGEASGSLEADVWLNNPMETVMPPDVALPENHHKSAVMPDSLSPTSLGETSHDRDEKVTPVKVSSRPKRHHSPSGTIETVNLDAIPLPTSCLDNSAAKHKLSVRPKNQRISKKHRLSKEVQSLIETDFGEDILESQGTEDKVTKDDSYYRPDKLTQHGEVHEQKTEGKRKQDHWIHLEAGKKEQTAETKFKSPMEHKRLQEFEGSQGEQVGKKLKLQEEQLYDMEEKKDQDHQEKGLKEQERQGRNGEGPEKLQAQIPKKSQDLEEQKQTDQEQAQHELEAQRQQEQRKPREMDTQWQKEKKKKQQELEAQRQQVEAKRQGELEVQRQQQEEQKRQCEMELQRQQEEAKRQLELEVQRQHKKEQKRQYELEVQSQHQEEARKQHELEIERQREMEQKRQRELELHRQRKEEQKRQGELELQRQREEEQKRHELELQRQRKEEQKRHELELQRQREEEQKRQRELELHRQRKEEQKRQGELELQRQREEEQKRQGELELQRQRKEEQKRHELELQRQREEEQKRHELELQRQRKEEQKRHELELQRQREEEQKRQRELELHRQREEEQKRQGELELQRQREEEQKRHELELQRQREEEQKRHELELLRQREEEQKRQRELELHRQREEEQKRQGELELQRQREEEQKRHELELQRQREEEQKRHELELLRQREEEQKRQGELELQRQREEEQKRQDELELQRQREEEQKRQRELVLQRQREEEQKRQRELELQRQREEEQKRQRELEIQRQREEEAKRRDELEIQRQRQEEQKRREGETQRQQEEKKKQYEQEEQKHKDSTIQKEQKVKDPKEEKRHQETELNDNLIQQGWKEKKEEPEKQKAQEEKISHPYLEMQKMKELKTVQTEKLTELNQQLLPEQKREIGQKKKEQENSKNLDDRNKLQEKAMKLKGQEEQQQNLNEKQFSTNEQKQQKSAKSVGSTEHSKIAPAETGHLRAEKEVQQEEFTQRTESEQLERHKILSLEDQLSLEKPKEEKKSHQLHMKKHREDEHLETVEKELLRKEEPRQQQRTQPGKEQKEEGSLRVHQVMDVEVEEQGRVLGEELRWQEVDARQTMSRGFTFQVSSGEKEIIFPKVNLSPVTPKKEAPLPSATKEFKDPKSSRGSSSLPTSSCVPHTAILVTGAQLCGTAVNLNQIKDTACKSLLGLTEEKKAMEAAQTESIQKPVDGRPNSAKAKHIQDAVDNQAILDEWASIRSKILKGAENDKFNEKDSGSLNRHSDDWTAKGQSTSHGNLRKTLSANAKFSITPAWQKFSEISKTAAENKTVPEAENAAVQPSPSTLHSDNEAVQTESPVGTKNVGMSPGKIRGRQEVAGNTEGCKFAKDLPSFLVPSLPYSPNKELSPSVETSSATETQHNVGLKKLDRASPGGEENVSPFGVKLRRTNYSLRFHYDQQAEQKKKKRYSAGDSFDGLPTPLTPDNEQDAKPLFLKDSKSLSQDKKDARLNSDNATLTIISRNYTIVAPVSSPTGPMPAPSQEKSASKSPLPPKPALAPKPISQTPPTSPLTKPHRSHFTEPIGKRVSKVEPDTSWRKSEGKGSPHPSQAPSESKNEEEESREKKSFFPSITMPWREKAEKKPEPLRKERPVLQSRHSIDGSKVMEKGETTQPLWITLALQKQKGFREQQATREERRQAREAKQAEKLAKENASVNNQADNKSNNVSRSNVLQKSTGPEEEKKMETATSRFERREQLKKSNTLPSSVTVEITDSLSSSPLAKEVTKRFSTPDANPVSTEPAWLALAKRKAKAWSDCPQIIK